MAGVAGRGEGAVVRVLVAGSALRKCDSHVLHVRFAAILGGNFQVTLLAWRALVSAAQAVFGSRMVEAHDVLPIRGDVATLAGASHLALVLVLVAGGAIPAETQVRALQVLHQNAAAGGRRDALGIMALITLEPRVAPVQRIARSSVIEFVETHIPANRHKVLAVVVGVALDALGVRRSFLKERWVEPAMVGEQLADFGVTGKALELPFSTAADVATGATRGAVERAMRLRKRTGRELRPCRRGSATYSDQNFQER